MAYKRTKSPKLTEIQKNKRLKFCTEKKDWTIDHWKQVLWSDESPFEVFHISNRQNDRIWAHDKSKVPNVETVKFSPRVMIWGMMSFQALSDLPLFPPKQTVARLIMWKKFCKRLALIL